MANNVLYNTCSRSPLLRPVHANFGGTTFQVSANDKQKELADMVEKLETILVADDTPSILHLVVQILRNANFIVLEAKSGEEAIQIAADHHGPIDLLLSDVQMPSMTGPELGETLKKRRPDLHVMLMSGLSGGSMLVLNYGWAFIEKPFLPSKLLEMVNVVLHTPNRSQGKNQYDTRKDHSGKE